jgi:hypothetical protein
VSLANLTVKIGADLTELNRGLADAGKGVNDLGNKVSGTGSSLSGNLTAPLREASRAAGEHHIALGRVNGALERLASEALGVDSKVGRLSTTFLEFGIGGAVTGGVLAGLAAIAIAWDKVTESSRESAKATEEAIKSLTSLRDQQRLGSSKGTSAREAEKAGTELSFVQDDLDAARKLLKLQREIGGDAAGGETAKEVARLEKRQAELRDIISAHEIELTRVRKEKADERTENTKKALDKESAAWDKFFARLAKQLQARRDLEDLTSDLIAKKFGVDKQPPGLSTVASEGLSRGGALDSISNLKIPSSVFASVVAVHTRAANELHEGAVRIVIAADELQKSAEKNLALGELSSLLAQHGGAVGSVLSGAINGALATKSPLGAIIGGGSALISTLLGHRKSVNDNTNALNRLTEAIYNEPTGFKANNYRYRAQDSADTVRGFLWANDIYASRGGVLASG